MNKKPKFDDDDISIDDWMTEIDRVLDAYANEVGMMRQFNKAVEKNLANLQTRVYALETEKAEYDKSIAISSPEDPS
jgi:hypothetical protein